MKKQGTFQKKNSNADVKSNQVKIPIFEIKTNNVLEAIQALKIDRGMTALLSSIDGLINIELGPQGISAVVVGRHDHKKICDITELSRVNSFKRFISEHEKIHESDEALTPILRTIKVAREGLGIPPFDPVNPDLVVKVREITKRANNLGSNIQFIERAEESEIKRYVLDASLRAKNVLANLVDRAIQGTTNRDSVRELCAASSLLYWTYNKLTNDKIPEPSSVIDLNRIIFPPDLSKGPEMSMRELAMAPVVEMSYALISNSAHIIRAFRNDGFVNAYILSGRNIASLTPSELEVFLGSTFKLNPPWVDIGHFIDHKVAGKHTTVERITSDSISALVKKASQAMITACQLEVANFFDPYNDVWTKLFPEEKERILKKENRLPNVFATVKLITNHETRLRGYAEFVTRKDKELFTVNFKVELGTSMAASPESMLYKSFWEGDNLEPPTVQQLSTARASAVLSPNLSQTDEAEFQLRTKQMRPAGTEKSSRDTSSYRRLTKGQTEGIEAISCSTGAKKALKNWLRGFTSEILQNAAFEHAMANFESKGMIDLDDDEAQEASDDGDN